MENKFCSKCGAEMPDDAKFCTKCGQSFEKITPKSYANKQKLNKKSLYALLAVFATLFLIIFGTMFYSEYSERREARLAREKFIRDSLEVVRQDSLKLVAQKEKEMLEAKKLDEFRKKFILSNIFGLLHHPDDASYAKKCGLSFLYKDSKEDCYDMVFGYEVEKGSKKQENWCSGYEVKATSSHSCYFEYYQCSGHSVKFFFKNKSDADYFFEMLKDNGLVTVGVEGIYYIPKKKYPKGITKVTEFSPMLGDALYSITTSDYAVNGWYKVGISVWIDY